MKKLIFIPLFIVFLLIPIEIVCSNSNPEEYHLKLLQCTLVDYDTHEEFELYPNVPASLRLKYSHRYYIKGSAQNINGVPPGPRIEADPGSAVTSGFFVAFVTRMDGVASGEVYTGRKISTLNKDEVWNFRDPKYGKWIGQSNQGYLAAGYEWWDESGHWHSTYDLEISIPLEPLPPLLEVKVNDPAMGTTDSNYRPGVYGIAKGTAVTVTAIPNSGYKFDHWTLDSTTSTENPITFTMDKDYYTLKAYFAASPSEELPPPPPSEEGPPSTGGGIHFGSPFELKCEDLPCIIEAIINFIFYVGITLLPLIIIIGGIMYATSGGDYERISTAKRIIFWAVVGLIIILLAKAIISVIRSVLGGG